MYRYMHKAVCHRGGGSVAPENTLAAMQCSYNMGFKAVEFDVMLSKDNRPFLHHDEEFGRTVKSSGKPNEFNIDELIKLDARAAEREDEKENISLDTNIPTFEAVLEYCKGNGIWMNIEIKPQKGFEAATGKEVACLTYGYFAQEIDHMLSCATAFKFSDFSSSLCQLPLFSSFSYEALMAAKQYAPGIPRGFLIDKIAEMTDWKDKMVALDAMCVHTSHVGLTQELVNEIKKEGYGIMCYTVNDVSLAETLYSWGVDSVCTDSLNDFQSRQQTQLAF